MAPSEMIGWECGACTFTNEDCSRRDCQMCMSERPERYAIVVGTSSSASAVQRPLIVVSRRVLPLLAAARLLLLLEMSLVLRRRRGELVTERAMVAFCCQQLRRTS